MKYIVLLLALVIAQPVSAKRPLTDDDYLLCAGIASMYEAIFNHRQKTKMSALQMRQYVQKSFGHHPDTLPVWEGVVQDIYTHSAYVGLTTKEQAFNTAERTCLLQVQRQSSTWK